MMILIYWNNHHHLFQTVQKVDGNILLTNGILLFFVSLVPFATAWMGENHFQSKPVALMGIVFLCSGVSYLLLMKVIITSHGKDSALALATRRDTKGHISWIGYLIGILLSYRFPKVSAAIYLMIGLIWLIPDRRIERILKEQKWNED